MPISNRGQATVVAAGSGTSITAVKPTGSAANDFAIVSFSIGGAGTGWVAPTGWTQLFAPVTFAGTFYAVYYRFLTGGAQDTPGASWTASSRNSAIMAAWPGVHQTTPFDAAVQVLFPASAQMTLALPSLTTVTDRSRIVSGATIDASSQSALTEPDEMVLLRTVSGSSGGREQSLADEVDLTSGSVGTRTWSQSASGYRLGGFIVALRPAPDPPVIKGPRTDTFAFTDRAVRTTQSFLTATDGTLGDGSQLYEQTAIDVTRPALTDTFGLGTETSSLFVITVKTGTDNFAFTDPSTIAGRRISVVASRFDNFNVSEYLRLSFSPETRTLRFTDAPVFVHPLRVIAQDIRTKQFLHWDLPLQNVRITYTLSGPQIITGTYVNENTELLDLGIEPWGTWIHIEDNGVIRASGILQPYSTIGYDQELNIEAHGVSAYPIGMPFLGEASYIQIDPATIVSNIWQHLQSRPDVNLGVQVLGSTTAKVGEPAKEAPPISVAATFIRDRIKSGQQYFTDWTWSGAPRVVGENNDTLIRLWQADGSPDAVDWLEEYISDNPATEALPFQLVWWEAPDCGEVVNTLVREAGFDFIETQEWNANKTDVLHFIRIADFLGTKRDGISFIEGENLINPVQIEEDTDMYASEVWVFGAGEGKSIIRGYYGGPSTRGRIRRTYILQDSTIKTDKRATEIAQYEWMRRQALLDVSEIVVSARHPNAPIGSFSVGDDVTLDTTIPWVGSVRQWERIISITFDTDAETMTLGIRRSETFKNG